MPCTIRILTPSGLVPAPYTAGSLLDAARHETGGVYTITNTFERTKVLKINAHLDRLEDSARREGIVLRLDRVRLRAAVRQLIEAADYGDVRFRITVSKSDPIRFILSCEPFRTLPAVVFEQGVRVVLVHDAARHNPEAKTTGWMMDRQAIEESLPKDIFTGVLVGDGGELLEGLSSNFYAILDGHLWTAGGGVLPGIAQQIVLEVAPAVLPVRREPVHATDIPRLSEAFVTSASRGIVPVVQIDDAVLGNGAPGPLTRKLRERYLAWAEANLEEL
ncbi:MAG TPA: aminotransferase class IV [Candidatus Limnocylindrales bacterium]|nr:aminotransferase class IV [Candidatus Limnocylindrales bacterium]